MAQTPIDPKSEAVIKKFYEDYYNAIGEEPSGSVMDSLFSGQVPDFLQSQGQPPQNNVSQQGYLMTDNPTGYGGSGDIDRQGRLIPRENRGGFSSAMNRARFGDAGYREPNQGTSSLTEEEFIEQMQERDMASGRDQLPYEQYKSMYQGNQGSTPQQGNRRPNQGYAGIPYINPGGSSYSSRLFLAGRGFGEEDRKGLGTVQGIAGLASAGIGMAGDFLSGLASKKRENYIRDWEQENRMQDKNYVAAPQYKDSNYLGGMPMEDGGMIGYQDGGLFDEDRRQVRRNERKATPGFKLFPGQYGDENVFEGENKPQNVGYGDPGFFGSIKKAMDINRETRQQGLDRDKVRPLAFHNRQATESVSFEGGGELGYYESGGKTPEGKDSDVKKSWRKGKKLAVYMGGKWRHFGDSSMQDFRSHKDKDRKKAWYDRHAKALKGDDPQAKAFRIYAKKTWEDGGMQPEQPQPQEQQGQAEQVMAMVSQAIQQGAQPQEVVQMLVQQGVPQEQAMQMVQQVVQAMQQQQPQMERGGMYGTALNKMPEENLLGKKPGDPITFKYGGKKYSGKVDKIENGKLFLK